MPRNRPDAPPPAALRALADGDGRLAVRVTPAARSEAVAIEDGRVAIRVRAKPENGKATAAALDLLARALEVAPSKVLMLRGATSREKLFRIPV